MWLHTDVSDQTVRAVPGCEFALDLRARLGVAKQVMRQARIGCCVVVLSTLLLGACKRSSNQICPQVEVSADPSVIEPGPMTTEIFVDTSVPEESDPIPIVTTLTAESGTFEDPRASETTFTCDPFAEGPVQICAEARFATDEEADGAGDVASVDDAGIAATSAYLRRPHIYLDDPAGCVQSACTDVECPENLCPVIEKFQLDQDATLPEANILVVASDPDGRPLELVTTLFADSGYFEDPHASVTAYVCDEFGVEDVELCVTASDGDAECDQTECGKVNCNACPFLHSLSPIPSNIPPGQNSSEIQVRAQDIDNYPGPFVLTLTASRGTFDDPHAWDTFFRCDGPGSVDVCAEVDDQLCKKSLCVKITCP